MKTILHNFIVLILLTTTTTLLAQENENDGSFFDGWDFGAKAGINFSNMYGDVGNNTFLTFAHAGLVIDKRTSDEWLISFEPHVSGEGQVLNGGYDRIIYFNIPFLGKYHVSEALSIDGGIHLGVKVTEQTKFQNGNKENRNRFKRIAPGFTAGVTYDITEDWFLQFRTNLKLSDVVRKEGGDSEGSTILAFQVSIGKRFN
ncbi:PorT family protein [Aureisphaera sp. CAU 1614]|uniref:PorT family protein n=1 Tax=Halomarinibacterium sedimenti TaxID=2857106 RepID=A0A9X1FSD5_9FLAO|nr:outer membrane beta-barrel protein [Halomarinibacterium sedimenti]MBW2938997.1 PorT family protein [Halomarinibacterium sedimenti]